MAILELPNGEIVVGGNFVEIGGVSANRIAKWNGSTWTTLGSGMNARVTSLVQLPNGDVIAGGDFSTAGGAPAVGVARWDGTRWSNMGSTSGYPQVHALAVMPDGDLIVAGSFVSFAGVAANHVVRWDGSEWSPLGSGLNGFALAAKVAPNGDLIVGGSFTVAGGQSAQRVARWNGVSWSGFGTGTYGYVFAVECMVNGDVIAGGEFPTAGGVPASRVARWNGSSWVAMGTGVSGGSFPVVFELAKSQTGALIAVGQFTTAGGVSASQIASWSGTEWRGFGSGLTGGPPSTVVVASNGDILVGGSFTSAGGLVSAGFARYSVSGIPTVSIQPQSISVYQGETIELSAAAGAGYHGVWAAWTRNDIMVADGPEGASISGGTVSGAVNQLPSPTVATPSQFTIVDAQPSDSGAYAVMFMNTCGRVSSAVANVTVVPTPTCPLCPADYDQDGGVTGSDVSAFFVDYEQGEACADVDLDGGVTGADIGAFFTAYEAGGC